MNIAKSRPVTGRVLDAAIAWQLRLGATEPSMAEYAEFDRWLNTDTEHARVWRQLGVLDQRLAATSAPARSVLLKTATGLRQSLAKQSRKLGNGLLGLLMFASVLLFGAKTYLPVDYWLAEHRTATGEQRSVLLADHSLVRLNTHSAIDVRFDAQQRLIVLQEGEILVETGSHDDPRPFYVETSDGRLQALGTKFLVRKVPEGTQLTVLQSAVAAHPQASGLEQLVRAGQHILMRRDGFSAVQKNSPGADAWVRGMLVMDNARLEDLVDELGRYRIGHLGISPELADLRVTGSFPLHDTDLALKALLPTLPVQIETHSPLWVTLKSRETPGEKSHATPL